MGVCSSITFVYTLALCRKLCRSSCSQSRSDASIFLIVLLLLLLLSRNNEREIPSGIPHPLNISLLCVLFFTPAPLPPNTGQKKNSIHVVFSRNAESLMNEWAVFWVRWAPPPKKKVKYEWVFLLPRMNGAAKLR